MRTGEQKGRQEGMILGALMSGKTPEEVAEDAEPAARGNKKSSGRASNCKQVVKVAC